MGYYTSYELSIYQKDIDITECVEDVVSARFSEINPDFGKDFLRKYVISGYETIKWYSYEEDMKELSKDFPDYVFYLEGCGEDFHDWWKIVFHDGRASQKNMVMEPQWPDVP